MESRKRLTEDEIEVIEDLQDTLLTMAAGMLKQMTPEQIQDYEKALNNLDALMKADLSGASFAALLKTVCVGLGVCLILNDKPYLVTVQ